MRKAVFGDYDQVQLKPVCSATETILNIGNLLVASSTHILLRERITKAQIRLRRSAVWSVPFLFACNKIRFSHDDAHIKEISDKRIFNLCQDADY